MRIVTVARRYGLDKTRQWCRCSKFFECYFAGAASLPHATAPV